MPEDCSCKRDWIKLCINLSSGNHAAGRGLNKDGVSHEEISINSEKMALNITNLIKGIIESYGN